MSGLSLLAIPDVDARGPVAHLAWIGPAPWIYSPAGWQVSRREAGRIGWHCILLTDAQLATLRATHLIHAALGFVRWSADVVPQPVDGTVSHERCDQFVFELATPSDHVRADVTGKASWAFALRAGKVVATSGRHTGTAFHAMSAPGIDRVVLYVQVPTRIGLCTGAPVGEGGWKPLARLQIPLREADPTLTTVAAEHAAARARLEPGETVTDAELDELARLLRPTLASGLRPTASCLWLTGGDADPVELSAAEPLRAAFVDPKWRRILGFAYSDRDPALVAGAAYEYQVTGAAPARDLLDTIYSLHTVPAGTLLPAVFSIGDVRVMLPEPATVTTIAPAPTGATAVVHTRRMLPLSPDRDGGWLLPELGGWSAVIDLPTAVMSVTLELGTHGALSWASVDANGNLGPITAVPAGGSPRLTAQHPFVQLRLRGTGGLCALRIETGGPQAGVLPVSGVTSPLVIQPTPLPDPPASITATSLQHALDITPENAPVTSRHDLGFRVAWMPAVSVTAWPASLPPPPLDAAAFELERATTDSPPSWVAAVAGGTLLGDRGSATPPVLIAGGDILASFPEQADPTPGLRPMHLLDTFEGARPVPGTTYQYRIRAIDLVGRRGAVWTESAPVLLEKRDPPPSPAGVSTRVLVAGDPDLTTAEQQRLGAHGTVVLLRWGWYEQQRRRDPSAREFRIYTRRDALDHVQGQLDIIVPLGPGRYTATLLADGALEADVSRGLRIEPGYPFEIETHTGGAAGVAITVTLVARVPDAAGVYPVPVPGMVRFPLRLDPRRTRPSGWSTRIDVVPITADETYELALPDALVVTPDHGVDRIMVGVSAADAEPYVTDALAPVQTRPGNEGPIAGVAATARWRGRPVLIDAPALADVPSILAPEPRGRLIAGTFDLGSFLAGTGIAPAQSLALERTRVDDVIAAYRFDGTDIRAIPNDVAITIGNAADRGAIADALAGQSRLADRYAVYLAAVHPGRDRLFSSISTRPMPATAVTDELPALAGRWIYRARTCDAAGNRSATAVVLRGVVRVAGSPPEPPLRVGRLESDPAVCLRLRVEDRHDLGDVIVFAASADLREPGAGASLLRIPNRGSADLRLRLVSGEVVSPIVIPTTGPGVDVSDGFRTVVIDGPWPEPIARVWAACTTVDGLASAVQGPWRILGGRP